ncbi:DUF2142 domain-containing protein [Lachnospiraceae bacterium MD335]|nr:DUF2142 domain-containing protein [Lachnospiraceae bacterium MD335]
MEEQKTKQFFIWIVSICGFILVFLSPPFTVPDEHTHFINAYCASELNFYADVDENASGVGKYVPQYIYDFVNKYRENYAGRLDEGYSFAESYFDSWLSINEADRTPVFWENDLTTINPVAYAASGLGIKVASIFFHICGGGFDTAYNLMLAGRLANLLFYITIGYWAISITPCLKKTMMLIMGMPMSIFLGASLSYDAILIPASMLFFAEFMKFYMRDDIVVNIKDMFTITFCVLFLVAVKKVCAPFILLLLLLPRTKFKSLRQYWVSIGLVIAVGIIAISPEIISKIITQGLTETVNPNVAAQKDYLYHNLHLIPSIIGNTIKEYSNFYLSGFVGKIGLLDTNFPILYIGLFWVVLLLIASAESCNIKKSSWKLKLSVLFVIMLIFLGMFLSMYISHTPNVEEPFGKTVSGVQGRYFIPVFCFLFVVMFNNLGSRVPQNITAVYTKLINNVTKFSTAINGILTIIIILLRYWC